MPIAKILSLTGLVLSVIATVITGAADQRKMEETVDKAVDKRFKEYENVDHSEEEP